MLFESLSWGRKALTGDRMLKNEQTPENDEIDCLKMSALLKDGENWRCSTKNRLKSLGKKLAANLHI